MKIDWKHLATTPGYISLKAAYIHDVQRASHERDRGQRPMRDKAEFLKKFRWVIGRAAHYAGFQGRPIDEVLAEWESNRTCWWLNYYQDCNQPKLSEGNSRKPGGIRAEKKYHRKLMRSYLSRSSEKRWRTRLQKLNKSNKSPRRWSQEEKARARRAREYAARSA